MEEVLKNMLVALLRDATVSIIPANRTQEELLKGSFTLLNSVAASAGYNLSLVNIHICSLEETPGEWQLP